MTLRVCCDTKRHAQCNVLVLTLLANHYSERSLDRPLRPIGEERKTANDSNDWPWHRQRNKAFHFLDTNIKPDYIDIVLPCADCRFTPEGSTTLQYTTPKSCIMHVDVLALAASRVTFRHTASANISPKDHLAR